MKFRYSSKKIICIVAIILLIVTTFHPMVLSDFILPEWGGGMVHSDPQMSENIRLPVPSDNVGKLWYRHDLGGELIGCVGNGIAGNGKIAANTFNGLWDNLIIYDYYGEHIWSSGIWSVDTPWGLNASASFSTPMVDIYDRVVACDNKTIILVNASDQDNVEVEWTSYIPIGSILDPFPTTPLSPTIVENKTIILPISNGPLLVYDLETGELLANMKLGQNETIDPYWGIPKMTDKNYSTMMSNYRLNSICPYRYNSTSELIEWNSSVSYGIMPFKRWIFRDGDIVFLVNRNNVTALEREGFLNWSYLASNNIENPGIYTGEGSFETLNSACVEGNRVFLATEYNKQGTKPYNSTIGRLYAIDVYPDEANNSVDLVEAWNYTYFGTSQASPILINDTLFFDGYNDTEDAEERDPHIYAVYTNGTERWNVSYDNITLFSFAVDPRGGFWYEDSDGWHPYGIGGNKLVHFTEEDGSIIDEIDMKTLINDTSCKPVLPCSCMTTCGTTTNPIMLMSANKPYFIEGKWVLAINLSDNNSILWNISIESLFDFNYAGGQYTIMRENNISRILFGTYTGGVMAVGTHPDCWFENTPTHQLSDSSDDINIINDAVNVSFTINSSIPDRVTVKAVLNPVDPRYWMFYRYREEKTYNVTPGETQGYINISLPKDAPEGLYKLHLYICNSSGNINLDILDYLGLDQWNNFKENMNEVGIDIDEILQSLYEYMEDNYRIIFWLLEKLEFLTEFYREFIKPIVLDLLGIYVFSDDKYQPSMFYMHPPNDPPDRPDRPEGPTVIEAGEEFEYTTRTDDPNDDQVEYRWKWSAFDYSDWSDPQDPGQEYTEGHTWEIPLFYSIKARAKDIWHSPNVKSYWSPRKIVAVSASAGMSNPNEAIVGQPAPFNSMGYGLNEPLNFSWTFYGQQRGEAGNQQYYIQTVNHTFNSSAENAVSLKITDNSTPPVIVFCNKTIESVFLISDFNVSSTGAQSNISINFNDTSAKNDTVNEEGLNWTWDFGDGNISYGNNTSHNYTTNGVYNVTLNFTDSNGNYSVSYQIIHVESTPPLIISAPCSSYTVGGGQNVTIYADFFDNQSRVKNVTLNIIYPDNTVANFTMNISTGDYDYEYEFNDTLQIGRYFYNIFVVDNANNSNWCAGLSFIVPPIAYVPPTPPSSSQSDTYIHVNISSAIEDSHYVFTDFNNDDLLWMRMDDVDGSGNPSDLSSYGNNGTKNGDANKTDNGKFGKAFTFDGSGDYIRVSSLDHGGLDYEDEEFTLSLWINTSSNETIISDYLESLMEPPELYGWNLNIDNGKIRYTIGDGDDSGSNIDGTTTITDNEWTHIVVVDRGETGVTGKNTSIYINGNLEVDKNRNAKATSSNRQFRIGSYKVIGSGSPPSYFNGDIDEVLLFNRSLDETEILSLYNASANQYQHNFTNLTHNVTYSFTGYAADISGNKNETETRTVTIDTQIPEITSVSDIPDTVGFGHNVIISANVTDNGSGINTVEVNITYLDNSTYYFTMTNTEFDTYVYNFSDTWLVGQYNYSIWVLDNAYNSNESSGYSFNVSVEANISVCTIKDEYGASEDINITDPPVNPTNSDVGYELLDDGDVLHIWNKYDSYYFNTSSGIQLTNHYDEYWSHNVLMLGYYNNDQWNLIYRTDELSGFNKDIDTDNETFVNATIWKNLNYNGYDFRLAIRYYLGVDDNELTIIPYIKNIDEDDIPYVLGFGWEMKDIQIDMTLSGDYIDVNRTMYYLNQTLDNTYTNLSEPIYCWNETANESQICGYTDPAFYLMENITDAKTKSLYLRWNQSLTYKLQVKSRTGQYNAPVTLFIRIGTLNIGQEKYTKMYWYDADQATYYFDSYDNEDPGEAWATNPGNMVDASETFASTSSNGDIELCDGNTCEGEDLGDISKVELRVYGYYTGIQRDIVLRPVFGGETDGSNYNYQTPESEPDWSSWFDITNDESALEKWEWNDVDNLDCDVEVGTGIFAFTLYCGKVDIRVTYTHVPEISNPYPPDGSTGISISPMLNITVSDDDKQDMLNITWYSNSSGSWQVFGTNNSVEGGTYHQAFSNATVNGLWWYWNVSVNDGTDTVDSSVYKFYTGYQSKIENTGSTRIKGYLLIQVQYNNSGDWIVEDDTINETTPRTINVGEQLALDLIFNGEVSTDDFTHGDGTYRIYAAFRDPDGDALVCDDESLLEAWYEFEVNTS